MEYFWRIIAAIDARIGMGLVGLSATQQLWCRFLLAR